MRRWSLRLGLAAVALLLLATLPPLVLFRRVPPPTSAFMLRAHFADPATGRACQTVHHHWVDAADLPREVSAAVVMAEDQRFRQHHGFDFGSIQKAVEERTRSGRVRGASTLTQQVAKNLFLWPGRSWLRKAIEAWYTVWLELLWAKPRILEVYLNLAQFGPCVFGVGAAAEIYFHRSARYLTPQQAALLAAVLPDPDKLRVDDPGPYTRRRAAEILSLMR